MPAVSVIRKAIAGTPLRRTRLHDEKGNITEWGDLAYLPVNLAYVANRIAFGRYPDLPWFTFGMIRRIERILDPGWSAIEFGCGSSTAWIARRVGTLHSIEHDPVWYQKTEDQLATLGIDNVRLELRELDRFTDLSDHEDGSLDFAIVDGQMRDRCMKAVLPKIKRGGYVYLDNSDKDMTIPNGPVRIAEQRLREEVARRGGQIEQHTGLTVGLLSAHEGTLARL
jgi:predicted O-methyltransferase YrrM